MARELKVYGWTGHRHECPPAPNGGKQTREIVAAQSWAEVARLAGDHKPTRGWGSETGNKEECAKALAEPRVVFWRPLDNRGEWRRA